MRIHEAPEASLISFNDYGVNRRVFVVVDNGRRFYFDPVNLRQEYLLDNLVQSCYDCNHSKGNMTYEAFSLLSYHKSVPSARICLVDVLAELTCSQQVARE